MNARRSCACNILPSSPSLCGRGEEPRPKEDGRNRAELLICHFLKEWARRDGMRGRLRKDERIPSVAPPFGADGNASSNTVRKPSLKRYSPENHVFDKSDSKVRHYLLSYDIVYPAIRACDVVYRRIRRRGCVSRIRLAGDRLVKEVENPARFRMHRTAPSMGPSVLSWICVHDDRPASEPRAPLK